MPSDLLAIAKAEPDDGPAGGLAIAKAEPDAPRPQPFAVGGVTDAGSVKVNGQPTWDALRAQFTRAPGTLTTHNPTLDDALHRAAPDSELEAIMRGAQLTAPPAAAPLEKPQPPQTATEQFQALGSPEDAFAQIAAPAAASIAASPVTGAVQVAKGVQQIQPFGITPGEDPAARLKNGVSDILEGIGRMATIPTIVAGAAAPLATARVLVSTYLSSKTGEKAAQLLGGDPDTQRLAGDAAAAAIALGLTPYEIGKYSGEQLADLAKRGRAVREGAAADAVTANIGAENAKPTPGVRVDRALPPAVEALPPGPAAAAPPSPPAPNTLLNLTPEAQASAVDALADIHATLAQKQTAMVALRRAGLSDDAIHAQVNAAMAEKLKAPTTAAAPAAGAPPLTIAKAELVNAPDEVAPQPANDSRQTAQQPVHEQASGSDSRLNASGSGGPAVATADVPAREVIDRPSGVAVGFSIGERAVTPAGIGTIVGIDGEHLTLAFNGQSPRVVPAADVQGVLAHQTAEQTADAKAQLAANGGTPTVAGDGSPAAAPLAIAKAEPEAATTAPGGASVTASLPEPAKPANNQATDLGPGERFLHVYGETLAQAVAKTPEKYGYGADQVGAVALKMASALAGGTANLNSPALKAAAKKLGVPNTSAGWKSYFTTAASNLVEKQEVAPVTTTTRGVTTTPPNPSATGLKGILDIVAVRRAWSNIERPPQTETGLASAVPDGQPEASYRTLAKHYEQLAKRAEKKSDQQAATPDKIRWMRLSVEWQKAASAAKLHFENATSETPLQKEAGPDETIGESREEEGTASARPDSAAPKNPEVNLPADVLARARALQAKGRLVWRAVTDNATMPKRGETRVAFASEGRGEQWDPVDGTPVTVPKAPAGIEFSVYQRPADDPRYAAPWTVIEYSTGLRVGQGTSRKAAIADASAKIAAAVASHPDGWFQQAVAHEQQKRGPTPLLTAVASQSAEDEESKFSRRDDERPLGADIPLDVIKATRRQRELLRKTYRAIKTRGIGERDVAYFDAGRRYTREELDAVLTDPDIARLSDAMLGVLDDVLAQLLGDRADGVERRGFVFDDRTYGVFVPKPGDLPPLHASKTLGPRRATILLNPFDLMIGGQTPQGAADQAFVTVVHEALHWYVGADGPAFETGLAALLERAGADTTLAASARIMEAYADPDHPGEFRESLTRLLSTYQDSRGRPARRRDVFGTSGSRAERPPTAPGEQSAAPDDVRHDRAGSRPSVGASLRQLDLLALSAADTLDAREPRHFNPAAAPATSSPAFKRWFQESQVVTDDGAPRVVYHGSNRRFAVFERRPAMRNDVGGLEARPYETTPQAFFFSESHTTAARYAKDRALVDERIRKTTPGRPETRGFYLSVQNPIDFTGGPGIGLNLEALGVLEDITGGQYSFQDWNEIQSALDDSAIVGEFRALGYDGAKLEENDGSTTWAVFEPTQIKSATRNRGTFDAMNPNVLQATIVPGAAEFVEQDVLPALKDTAQLFVDAASQLKRSVAPATVGAGVHTAGALRSMMAAEAAENAQMERTAHAFQQQFDRLLTTPSGRDQAIDWWDAVQTGQPTKILPELQAAYAYMRKALDDERVAMQKVGKLDEFNEFYFPQIWKSPREEMAWVRRKLSGLMGRRPFEGSKSFLKQRKYPTFREGLTALQPKGIEPISYNPVDHFLIKMREMRRYRVARQAITDFEAMGIWKAFTGKHPEGWTRIEGALGTIYGPPEVRFDEAFDPDLFEGLERFARSLGVTLERKPNIGRGGGVRNAWGLAYGDSKIVTKAGGPEGVLMHEIGHILDEKYGLRGMVRDKKFKLELRNLADLRREGLNVRPGFERYIRKGEEKIANLVHAFLYAPERAKKIAPNSYWALYNLAKKNKELKPLLTLQKTRSLKLGTRTHAIDIGGFPEIGHYAMPDDAARIFNNHLSRGLAGQSAIFDAYRWLNNSMVTGQLAFSGLRHLTFTGLNAAFSEGALVLQELSRAAQTGDWALAGQAAKRGAVLAATGAAGAAAGYAIGGPLGILWATGYPLAALKFIKGWRGQRAWLTEDPGGRFFSDHVRQMVEGGFRPTWDDVHKTGALHTMLRALRQGNYPGALLRTIPAVVDGVMLPIMSWAVPSIKTAAYLDGAAFELDRLKTEVGAVEDAERALAQLPKGNARKALEPDQKAVIKALESQRADNLAVIREALNTVQTSIDNRFGEVIYDNWFWERWRKDLLHVIFRAPGWQAGTYKEAGGAVADLAGVVGRARSGGGGGKGPGGPTPGAPAAAAAGGGASSSGGTREDVLSGRMAYVLAMVGLTMLMNGMAHYLSTGQRPEGKDWLYPKGPDGKRRTPVTYLATILSALRDPKAAVAGITAPINSALYRLFVSNETWNGEVIREPGDPFLKQAWDALRLTVGEAYAPFSVTNALRAGNAKAESVMGVGNAPAAVTRSDAENYLHDVNPSFMRTHEEQQHLDARRQLRDDLKAHKGADVAKDIVGGSFTRAGVKAAAKANLTDSIVKSFTAATLPQALHAYELATPEERREIRPLLYQKYGRLIRSIPADTRPDVIHQFTAARALPVATARTK